MYTILIFILAPPIGKKITSYLNLHFFDIYWDNHCYTFSYANRFIYFGEIKIWFLSLPMFQSESLSFSYWFVWYSSLYHVGVFLPVYCLLFSFCMVFSKTQILSVWFNYMSPALLFTRNDGYQEQTSTSAWANHILSWKSGIVVKRSSVHCYMWVNINLIWFIWDMW